LTAYPVAYCAPGSKTAAALTLMLKGEQVAEIAEHPWLAGHTDILVVREDPHILLSSEALRVEVTSRTQDAIRFRWEEDLTMRTVRRRPPPSALVDRD
jgi:hypothetical protein